MNLWGSKKVAGYVVHGARAHHSVLGNDHVDRVGGFYRAKEVAFELLQSGNFERVYIARITLIKYATPGSYQARRVT